MKTTLVRFSVLALAVSGFTASSILSQAQMSSAHTNKVVVKSAPIGTRMPLPCCPWNAPEGCGF